ncbi:MAG: shikimate dehydrogenase [Clostridia bacterium]|nr:shikimate dehydrogenase [Clostridia bacterium]
MKYGLIGEHLPHSFSKEVHAKIAPYSYELCELERDEVDAFMRARDFEGINVTIPYKQTVIPYLTEIDEAARLIGAVNTIVNRDGKLYGYNTDFYGMKSLILRLGLNYEGAKVLILGTGGTSKTAVAVARHLGAADVIVVGRKAGEGVITYEDAYRLHTDADQIINTTPCGMYPYPDGKEGMAGTPIDLDRFPKVAGVIDAVYNPIRTNLVMDAIERNIPAVGGLYMLVAQAVKAAEYFMGTKLPDELYESVYRDILASKENIVLTGMPGSGKSTIGKMLSESLGRPFCDTDAEIVKNAGMSIPEIFERDGNDGFRRIESEAVIACANRLQGAVIATGGGAILRDDNVRALKRTGRLYFLNRSLSKILPTDDRPLSRDREALEARFRERYPRYLATCDKEIVMDEIPENTVKAITEDMLQ